MLKILGSLGWFLLFGLRGTSVHVQSGARVLMSSVHAVQFHRHSMRKFLLTHRNFHVILCCCRADTTLEVALCRQRFATSTS